MHFRRSPWGVAGCVAVLLWLCATPAFAHPHIFIDYTVTVIFDDHNAASVRTSWTFDEMYSSALFHDYTSRPKGPLTNADINRLRKSAFEDTAELHYFTDLTVNGKPIPVKTVSDFTAKFENHRITYIFTVPIKAELPGEKNTLEVASFDHEFFIDFELAKKGPVTVEHGETLNASCAPKKTRKKTSTFGQIDTVVVACTYGKNG